jgi:hypothetical protein
MIVAKQGDDFYAELAYWAEWDHTSGPQCSLNESIVQLARNAKAEIERLRGAVRSDVGGTK